jgi:hypothetical protein
LFLKNALGEGNNLTVVKDLEEIELEVKKHLEADENNQDEGSYEHTKKIVEKKLSENLLGFIQTFIPSAKLKKETLREYQFVIPLHERTNSQYWKLFKELDLNLTKLRILSYGIHDVSLEEIFIRAAELNESSYLK